MSGKKDIKSLDHNQLEEALGEMGQPRFRVKQLEQWLYGKQVSSFQEMTNLSKALREDLAENYDLSVPEVLVRRISRDESRKYLLRLADGAVVETVGIPSHDGNRLTVCFSTQVGCGMGCIFCATGHAGFTRNLTVGEMVDQIHTVAKDFDMRVSNVVGMGQGEPFANYDAVLQALRYMNSPQGLEIGARHITVSTCGIIKGIQRFMEEPEQFTLAVSLHSAVQKTRDQLMPGVKGQPLQKLWEILKIYGDTTKRRPTLEYAPIAGINDDEEHIEALVDFCRGMLSHVNLIPLNPLSPEALEENPTLMEPSPHLHDFEHALTAAGVEVSIRNSRGSDIDGACGQLAGRLSKM